MIIVYINCKLFPFIDWIISGLKVYETRNRNTLKSLVGKTIYFAETGTHKRPVIRCACTIDSVIKITDRKTYNLYRRQTKIKKGSAFDWKTDTKYKYLYKLSNVIPVPSFPVPDNIIRHGRTWAEIETETKNGDPLQWVADVYHCSDIWGQKMTKEEMFFTLAEHILEKDQEEYSPSPYLFEECCEYWNQLCDTYPN